MQHEPSKYDYIDTGAQLSKRPTTVVPPKVQAAPASVSVSVHYVVDQGISRPTMTIAWEQAANAVDYTVEWKKDSGEWIPAGTVGGQSTDVQGIYRGVYQARVRARNSMGVYSLATLSEPMALEGKTGAPPVVVSLNASKEQIGQIEVDWAFPADHSADDTQRTEVWYSKNPTRDGSESKQGDYAYPTSRATLLGLTNGASMFFWVRLVDRTGNVGAFYPDGVGVNAEQLRHEVVGFEHPNGPLHTHRVIVLRHRHHAAHRTVDRTFLRNAIRHNDGKRVARLRLHRLVEIHDGIRHRPNPPAHASTGFLVVRNRNHIARHGQRAV
ncbi:hypothetical protein L0Y97_18920 [Burkholderia multivorans]|uniref:hypothetical protein n=1 Tax=Burkholderia multivorans TaxID=87883 RepID=UPI0020197E8F|nr:hypothetical protein [Burkholderia multivorans]MCO1361017.1 hypothetical protein [Burkholderia multivorans]MCO1420787.1 hypothetical protein [Burkholderia multivorans]UQO93352.1 hypothetical protein L0Z41_08875 [Burkholderia multivorans]